MTPLTWPDRLPPFLWGVATSAHQVEGGNTANDWAHCEAAGRLPPAGRAADHWRLWAEDLDRFQALGLNAYRFSVEWSRIEPDAGVVNADALDHYRAVVDGCRARGLEPLVTLHHFTLPWWLARRGGFLADDAIARFRAHVDRVVRALAGVRLWCTINEPGVLTVMGYLRGVWPPFLQDPARALAVWRRLHALHRVAYDVVKRHRPEAWVGLAHNMLYPLPARPRAADRWAARLTHRLFNLSFAARVKDTQDFIGLNYYSPAWTTWRRLADPMLAQPGLPVTDMGWAMDARGLEWLLRDLARRFQRPLIVTENGIATEDDALRRLYLETHLEAVARARRAGADVRGYFYWSGIDNYEWAEGFRPRFGLYRVDYDTETRTLKPGADILSDWARRGAP
jgi:beta-glucosidase